MGYKKIDPHMTFAEVSLLSSMEHNRSLKRMERINATINWSTIESVLMKHYTTGTSREGADAYPPLMLLKGLLLQKWFQIDSDPELETQINDRISFKKFLGISFDKPSPDHSTFSRFRSRLSKDAMTQINNAVLQQFASKGLSINEGIAIDARLVQSASRPISNDEMKQQKETRETSEGNLDKKGNIMKFSRDLESDWTVRNNIPFYGLKEHASVDVIHGFVLATDITPASVHDSNHLPYCVAASCHTDMPVKKVYADKGYYGEPNRTFLHMNDIRDGIMRKATRNTRLTDYEKERNKQISKKRYIVEQYFGLSHLHDNAFRARFTKIMKNLIDVMCRQMAFNLFRGAKIIGTA
jgi:IS5 family transposase